MVGFLAWFGFVGFGGCFVGSFLLCFFLLVVLIVFVLVLGLDVVVMFARFLLGSGFAVFRFGRYCAVVVFVVVLCVYCYVCEFCSLR